jgi:hypothetical protein
MDLGRGGASRQQFTAPSERFFLTSTPRDAFSTSPRVYGEKYRQQDFKYHTETTMSVMDLGRGGVCLRRDLYKDDFAELNVGRRSTAVKPVLRGYLWDKEKMAF